MKHHLPATLGLAFEHSTVSVHKIYTLCHDIAMLSDMVIRVFDQEFSFSAKLAQKLDANSATVNNDGLIIQYFN